MKLLCCTTHGSDVTVVVLQLLVSLLLNSRGLSLFIGQDQQGSNPSSSSLGEASSLSSQSSSGESRVFPSLSSSSSSSTTNQPIPRSEYHMAPKYQDAIEVDYSQNPTAFGRILDGSLPANTIQESDALLAFEDRIPRAPLHALVIPKQYIPSMKSMTFEDLPLLYDMHDMALSIIKHYYPQAYDSGDYILCYHVPPFNSVDHLHQHVPTKYFP